jgi:hypothetical protein
MRGLKSALPLLLVVLVGAAPPPIILIEIVPSSVIVYHNRPVTSFELEARLWTGSLADRRSIIESDGYTLVWSSNQSWLKKTGGQGFRAVFSIDQPNIQGAAIVQVTAGNKSNTTTVTVIRGPGPGEDFLTATYTPGQVPDVALVSGVRNTVGGPCVLTFQAFVAGLGLGNLVDRCNGAGGTWKAAVLSAGHKSVVATGPWTPQQNTVNVAGLQGGSHVVPVTLRVMVAGTALSPPDLKKLRDETMTLALGEIESANGTLASTRTGIKLAKPDTATIVDLQPSELTGGRVIVSDCRDGDVRTLSRDVPGKPNVHVYYVDWLYGARGRACPPHQLRRYPVIYVDVHSELETSLVHEVGHALGATLPRDGHTNLVGGLDLSNVMTKGNTDWDPGARRRLTVGQVFRMNTDSASWLSWATDGAGSPVRESTQPRLACQCGGGDPAGSCPRMRDDVAPPSADPDSTSDRDCWDRLFLKDVQTSERPVAIIAGRRWRAPPDYCDPFLHGWDASLPGEVWVGLGNVTRHGDCKSRAVLFYPHFGVQVVNLAEPDLRLTQVSDDPTILGSPSKPTPVRVRVYFVGAMVTPQLVAEHTDIARTIFGPLNRTGITLVFLHYTTPCPQAGPHPGEIQVCYVPGMISEATLTGERRIKVGKARMNTVSHFIGRALGLAATSGLSGNIMQPIPEDRGRKLTLGQVFRINVTVGALTACDSTAPCPPLDLDVGP